MGDAALFPDSAVRHPADHLDRQQPGHLGALALVAANACLAEHRLHRHQHPPPDRRPRRARFQKRSGGPDGGAAGARAADQRGGLALVASALKRLGNSASPAGGWGGDCPAAPAGPAAPDPAPCFW